MFDRPTLRPMTYRLWVPAFGTYVQRIERNNRKIVGTLDPATALHMPEPQALAVAHALIRGTRHTIELRPVDVRRELHQAECRV